MVEPISLSIAIISLMSSIATAIAQIFSEGVSCNKVRSDCCKVSVIENEGMMTD